MNSLLVREGMWGGKKLVRDWCLSFLLAIVPDVLWHRFLFGGFYASAHQGVARVVDGALSPIIPAIVVMDVLFAFGFVYFVNRLSIGNGQFVRNGLVFGLLVTGYFSLASYALIPDWSVGVGLLDTFAGVIAGALQGLLFGYLYKRDSASSQPHH